MAEDLIIARFQADITDYRSKLLQLESELNKLSESEKKTAEDQKKVSSELATASQKRTAALKNEEAELKRLQVALKQAFTAPEINKINGQINSVKSNISALKGETSGLGKVLGGLGGQFAAIGAGVAAAFSVQAIISFATDSVKAFREAEVNANKLKFAVTSIANEGVPAFERLIQQSARLQKISIFSDDDIQRTQTQLLQFGLTADEVEKLIPKVLDLASATGKDLSEATDTLIQGINGQTRALKPLGLEFKNTGDKAENLAIITEKLNKFQGASAELLKTSAGEAENLTNKIDDLKEKIGESIANSPLFKEFKGFISKFVESFTTLDELQAESQRKRLDGIKKTIELGIKPQIELEEKLAGVQITTQEKIDAISQRIADKEKEREDFRKEQIDVLNTLTNEELTQRQKKLSDFNVLIAQEKELLRLEKEKKIVADENAKLVDGQKVITEEIKATIRLDVLNRELLTVKKELNNPNLTKQQTTAIQEQIVALKELINVNPTKLGKTDEQIAKDSAASEAARQKELENQRKLQQEINKLAEENLKNQESLRQQFVKSQQDALDVELKNKLVALSELQLADEDYAKQRILLEIDTQKKLIEVDSLSFDEKQRAIEKLQDLQIKFNELITANNQSRSDKDQKAANDLADDIAASWQRLEDEKTAATKKGAADREEAEKLAIQKTFDLSNELASAIFQISSDNLRKTQDEETQALQTSKDNALSNKRLTETEKDRINKEFAAKELALKKKQFEENKKQARSEAVIKGALAIINALATANNIYAGLILAAAIAAETAIEIGVINSQKFAKGTKKAKGGMATVGEEGPEFMYVPNGAKILTAKQTRQHSRLIDAMYDGHLDKIIHQDYILPALQKQKISFEKKKEQTFSNNLAKSLIFNGLTGNEMERIRKRGTDINNIDELVEKLASVIQTKSNPRRF